MNRFWGGEMFPRMSEANNKLNLKSNYERYPMENKIKVLHVDDDDDIRLITRLALSLNPDFEVEQCCSGMEALEKAGSFAPDVFLLDMMMPGMTGEETWQALIANESLADVPAIFMSAKAEQSFATRLIAKGAIEIITKPFDPMTLCDQIENAIKSQHPPLKNAV